MRIEFFNLPGQNKPSVSVARLDANDSLVSGNKAYKLKPWLNKAQQHNKGLLSCGGAWSNHLHALAAAGLKMGIPTAALVRAYEIEKPTSTLQDCLDWGMRLFPVERSVYAQREQPAFTEPFMEKLDFPALWVPEGGTSAEAVAACEDIGHELNDLLHEGVGFDSVWVAVGSGGTVAGIARTLDASIKLIAVPVMSVWQGVAERVHQLSPQASARIIWRDGAAYGGFGRMNNSMRQFMLELDAINTVQWEPVYTAKVCRRLDEALQAEEVIGEKPLILHTGGLQGRRGMAV